MSILSGAFAGFGEGLSNIASKFVDDDIQTKRLELQRQWRLDEQKQATAREDSIYNRDRADKLSDYSREREDKLADYDRLKTDKAAEGDTAYARDVSKLGMQLSAKDEALAARQQNQMDILNWKLDHGLSTSGSKSGSDDSDMKPKDRVNLQLERLKQIAEKKAYAQPGSEEYKQLEEEEKTYAESVRSGLLSENSIYNKSKATQSPSKALDTIQQQYGSLIDKYSNQFGVQPEAITALIGQESSGNSGAISPTGVKGLMQVTEGTYSDMKVPPELGDRTTPEGSIYAGTKYFAQQLKQFKGDIKLASIAYNAGPGVAEMALNDAKDNGDTPNGDSALKYVGKYVDAAKAKEVKGHANGVYANYVALTGDKEEPTQLADAGNIQSDANKEGFNQPSVKQREFIDKHSDLDADTRPLALDMIGRGVNPSDAADMAASAEKLPNGKYKLRNGEEYIPYAKEQMELNLQIIAEKNKKEKAEREASIKKELKNRETGLMMQNPELQSDFSVLPGTYAGKTKSRYPQS